MIKCVRHCKDNEPCNHINYTCSNGCLDGWIGVNCDKREKYKMCLLKANRNVDELVGSVITSCYISINYLNIDLTQLNKRVHYQKSEVV